MPSDTPPPEKEGSSDIPIAAIVAPPIVFVVCGVCLLLRQRRRIRKLKEDHAQAGCSTTRLIYVDSSFGFIN